MSNGGWIKPRIMILILVIVFVAALGFGVYYFVRNYEAANRRSETQLYEYTLIHINTENEPIHL